MGQWTANEEASGKVVPVSKEHHGREWIVVDQSTGRLMHIHVRCFGLCALIGQCVEYFVQVAPNL